MFLLQYRAPCGIIVLLKGRDFMEKEFLYFGYIGDLSARTFKIGTTNDLDRRRAEHCRAYKLPFTYLWHVRLSKWNTLRHEQRTKDAWKKEPTWEYIRNDRFIIPKTTSSISITIRKTYLIELGDG